MQPKGTTKKRDPETCEDFVEFSEEDKAAIEARREQRVRTPHKKTLTRVEVDVERKVKLAKKTRRK